jgi:hypothetical protein
MSIQQTSLFNFNIFDILGNLIPGLVALFAIWEVFAQFISASLPELGPVTLVFLLAAAYVIGHLTQYLAESIIWGIFGHPQSFEKHLKNNGLPEILDKYNSEKNPEWEYPDGPPDVLNEFTNEQWESIETFLLNESQVDDFQTTSAKLLFLVQRRFRIPQPLTDLANDSTGELFQYVFTDVANRNVGNRVERFFAISNLFLNLAGIFLLMAISCVVIIWIRQLQFVTIAVVHALGFQASSFSLVASSAVLSLLSVMFFTIFALCYRTHRTYHRRMTRALIADFVVDHLPKKLPEAED